MKKHYNMTGESDFEGNEAFFEENRPITLDIWYLVLTLIFLASFLVLFICFFRIEL